MDSTQALEVSTLFKGALSPLAPVCTCGLNNSLYLAPLKKTY